MAEEEDLDETPLSAAGFVYRPDWLREWRRLSIQSSLHATTWIADL